MYATHFPHNPQYYVTAVMTATRLHIMQAKALGQSIEDVGRWSLDAPSLLPAGSVARATNRSGPAPTWVLREE